jgi:transposase-like protein
MARDGRNVIHLVKDGNGRPVGMATLPPPNLRRWLPQHKAEVVAAVRKGVIRVEQACERYDLSFEEFLSWEEAV